MSDAKAGFSWTHFELMGEALSPDKWEHSTQVSMETNDVIRAQWLAAFSSKGGLGCMILNKLGLEETKEQDPVFHGKNN